jgi:translation initiation factor IF-2
MRIYELAKELGVENKVVLMKASELGMIDKTSHSNSLRPDEADKIRRALIRQAVGTPSTAEVVTKRVDKATGMAESLVERRVGNVIRRRKAGGDSGNEHQESTARTQIEEIPTIDISQVAPQNATPLQVETKVIDDSEIFKEGALKSNKLEVVDDVDDEVVEETKEPEVATSQEVVTEQKAKVSGVGPRVLGRMDLPLKKPAFLESKTAAENKAASNGAARKFTRENVAVDDEEEEQEGRKFKGTAKKKIRKREISSIDLVDYDGRAMRRTTKSSKSSKNKGNEADNQQLQTEITKPKASKRVVRMDEMITVGELAKQMSLKAGEVIAKLIELGVMATINQSIDAETATIIAEEFEYQIERTGFDETDAKEDDSVDSVENLKARPPVVTVMGHVDHGKTSLLDAIRNTSVAAREHGGITQHIGAYSVVLDDGRRVTFIDTPGHAAFTSMRARGAKVTDIVILVVAADDGVMPQTLEAVNHAKAAGVPIIVAVNKTDKPDSKPDRVKQQLAERGLNPEDWGGDTMYFNVSALKGTGLKELLEGVLLLAEVKELKANPERRAKGAVIESKQDKGRGTVATVLVQTGTLKVGDIFVCGAQYGKVRSMTDSSGEKINEAGPSYPVEITGFSGVPEAGDDFFVVENDATARQVSATRAEKLERHERSLASGPISLEEFARRANNLAAAELNVIMKADVAGSVDAVKESIEKLSTAKVKVRVLHAAVGGINESDIQLAVASNAIVVGFGVRAEPRATDEAERAGVQIRFYRVIYELIDDVRKAMIGLLDPIKTEVPTGRVEVRDTFSVSKIGTIAGCYVLDGIVKRTSNVRVVRDSKAIYEGKISSLKRFKDDAKEVQSGYECGIGIDRFNDVKPGDIFEIYEIKESEASLE